MKKFITLSLILLTTFSAHADRFGGVWKHKYLKLDGQTVRLSYKEKYVVPTYGLNQGGRQAYKVHLDVWGNFGWESLDYRFITEKQEYIGTLIKENSRHQYDLVTNDFIWLKANRDYKHSLVINRGSREYRYELDL